MLSVEAGSLSGSTACSPGEAIQEGHRDDHADRAIGPSLGALFLQDRARRFVLHVHLAR